MRRFRGDLHIHTCLSPCADLDMSPRGVAEKSVERGLDFIAVCDHNSVENAGAVIRAGARRGLQVLPGMEISSREEVHLLAIFDDEAQALAMQEVVYRHLRGTNRPEIFGDQVVANEFDEDFKKSPDQQYVSGRWSVKIDWAIYPGRIVLFHYHEGYPSLERASDFYLTTEQGVRLSIIKNFFAALQINYRYDNTPPPGRERSDTVYLISLGYNFDLTTTSGD